MLNKNQFVCPPKNKNVPQNFCQGDKLSLSDQILTQTLPLALVASSLLLGTASCSKDNISSVNAE